jgi:hypothetical protein
MISLFCILPADWESVACQSENNWFELAFW